MQKIKLILGASILLLSAQANASPIFIEQTLIDTGPGLVNQGGTVISDYQFVANRFETTKPLTWISSVEFWLGSTYFEGGTATAVVYANDGIGFNGGETPGTKLYSQDFEVEPVAGLEADWRGVSDLLWFVLKGSYWLSIEVPDGEEFFSYINNGGVPNPLGASAIKTVLGDQFNDQWRRTDGTTGSEMGIRIYNKVLNVPEPPAILLFGIGLIGLIGFSKRRKAA